MVLIAPTLSSCNFLMNFLFLPVFVGVFIVSFCSIITLLLKKQWEMKRIVLISSVFNGFDLFLYFFLNLLLLLGCFFFFHFLCSHKFFFLNAERSQNLLNDDGINLFNAVNV